MKISMDKKYRTKNGCNVKILHVGLNTDSRFKNVGILIDNVTTKESVLTWSDNGYFDILSSILDLVEVSPYEDFKVDDPVLVSADGTNWHRAHFAYPSDGYVCVFEGGKTEFSSVDKNGHHSYVIYPFCKKA